MKNQKPVFTSKSFNTKSLGEIYNRFRIQGLCILPIGRTAEVFRGLFETTQCAQFVVAQPTESFKQWGFDNAFLLKTFDPVFNEKGFDYFLSKDCFIYFSEYTEHKDFIKRLFSDWTLYPNYKEVVVPSVKENKLFMEHNGMFQGETADVVTAFQECLEHGYKEQDAPMFGKAQKLLNTPVSDRTQSMVENFFEEYKDHPHAVLFKEILSEFL